MADTAPRGRPRTTIDPASLPTVARVLLTAADAIPAASREEVRRACRNVSPTVASVGRALAILRPRDKDGGWGWFGRALAKESGRTSPAAPE